MKSSSQEIEEWRRAGFSVPERSLFMFDRWMHISLEFMVRYYVPKWGLKRRKPMKYLAAVALLLAGCFASLCEAEEPKSKVFTPEVGKEYVPVKVDNVLTIRYSWEVDSITQGLIAGDKVGLVAALREGRASAVGEGYVIRVLEVTQPSIIRKYGYAECRLRKEDTDMGKWYVPLAFFQTAYLTPATK